HRATAVWPRPRGLHTGPISGGCYPRQALEKSFGWIMNRFSGSRQAQARAGSNQAKPASPLDGRQLVVHLELGHRIGQMKVHGAFAAIERVTAFARRHALKSQAQALQFTRAQGAARLGQRALQQRPDIEGRPDQLRRLTAVMPLARAEQIAFEGAPYGQRKRY